MRVREAVNTFRGHRVPAIRLVERKNWWFALSGFFIVLSLVGLFARGLNFSIDFKGGALLTLPDKSGATASDFSAVMTRFGRPNSIVEILGGGNACGNTGTSVQCVNIRTSSLTSLGVPSTPTPTPSATASPTGGSASAPAAGTVGSATIPGVGTVLVNAQGFTLYHMKTETASNIRCTGACEGVWPPLLAAGGSPKAGPGVTGTLGTTPRPGGAVQVTYGGQPLYTYSGDTSPGQANGQGVQGVWFAVTASGTGAAGASASPTPSATPSATGTSSSTPSPVVTSPGLPGGGSLEADQLRVALARVAGVPADQINQQDVGPTWGSTISKKAIEGLIIFLILVTLYISFRFEPKMAGGALVALAHDLIITAGIYALVGRQVSPASVIAILTILGYSLYDTVVIFDKIKENTTDAPAMVARETYSGMVNVSLNQTLMRSVNTSLVVLLPIGSLLLFGGQTLKDFAFALFVGVASGTYSSIFVAAPVLTILKEREPRYQQIRQRAAVRAQKPGLRVVPARASLPAGADGTDGHDRKPAAVGPKPGGGSRPGNRPSGGSKKKGRPKPKRKRR